MDPIATRGWYVGTDPATGYNFLSALPDEANPLPSVYLSAGIMVNGRRLWAPARANPASIRRVFAGHAP